MTNEQAIYVLKNIAFLEVEKNARLAEEALNMAIEALSAQPEIILCNDCCHYPSECADCPMIGWARNENDFCSKAERKIESLSELNNNSTKVDNENDELSCSEKPNRSDLISRQAAIDVLDVLCQEHRYRIPGNRETYSQYNEAWQDALDRAENAIGNLPSAQPEIIYCKDCKWCEDADGLMCKNPTSWVVATDCDFGCVLAERRAENVDANT